jgi:periplasmic divalent cation tolerance protein
VAVPAAEHIVVLVTSSGKEEAKKIAKRLLDERKAACVNIIDGVSSLFIWQGSQEEEQESLLVIKSSASLLPHIVETVKQVHSYDVPEIIALPVLGGNEDYLAWIDSGIER